MSRVLAPGPLLPPWKEAPRWVEGRLRVPLAEREFVLTRGQDMDALWETIGEDAFGDDERMPYWAEVWPASLLLTAWLLGHRRDIEGRTCLELGCGMGLSALAGAVAGGRVVAVDYEERAIAHAAANATANAVPVSLAVMDWRRPCLAEGRFEVLWGSDILYETRFYAPLVRLFRTLPAPGGRIWLSEPLRQVSRPVWGRLIADGFRVRQLHEEVVPFSSYSTTVALYEIRL
jgi:ETFB lysine methyltransferase